MRLPLTPLIGMPTGMAMGWIEETKYTACEAPSDYVDSVGDCNDLDPYINPDAQERCD